MKNKPFVIFIDGTDGCGKSTLTRELCHQLADYKLDQGKLDLTFDTYDIMQSTGAGKLIREAMITEELDEPLRFNGFMYGVFYGLRKLFEQGGYDVMICDRSQATTFAYNICAPDMPATVKNAQIAMFDLMNTAFYEQHRGQFINVVLELDPLTAFERMAGSRVKLDVIERRGALFQEQVARGFVSYFHKNDTYTNLMKFNTGNLSAQAIAKQIVDKLIELNVV
jgi:thymidylate kinase